MDRLIQLEKDTNIVRGETPKNETKEAVYALPQCQEAVRTKGAQEALLDEDLERVASGMAEKAAEKKADENDVVVVVTTAVGGKHGFQLALWR